MVHFYTDFACPFCYLAEAGVTRLLDAGYAVENRAFELRPAPIPLESPASDPYKVRGWELAIAPAAREAGLEMKMPVIGVRTRKAHEAARHARSFGLERGMRQKIYEAYFRDGLDISRIDVLVELGAALGMDRTELKVTLDIDQHSDVIGEEERDALRIGIDGVPAYVAITESGTNADVIAGLQEYDRLLKWIERVQ